MKIAHLNTYVEGGAAEASLRIHQALLNEGVTSKYIALYKARCITPEVYDFRKELSEINFWFSKIKNKQRTMAAAAISEKAGEFFSDLSSVWKVQQHPAVKEADLVHLHWTSNYVDLPSYLKTNKKTIWTLHDHFPFSGGFHYPPITKDVIPDQKIEDQKKMVKELFSSHPIDVVCPSQHLKGLAMASGLMDACRFHVIKNPVDTGFYKPQNKDEVRKKLNIPGFKKVIFFLADHIQYARKGFALLEQALDLIEHDVTILVAGRGQLPVSIGKADVVQFGLIKDKEFLVELYNCSDVLVNPSLDDISSNTIIEAMACGIPAVAFESGGIPELITPVNGILVKEKTAQALAHSIDQALGGIQFDHDAIRNKSLNEHSLPVAAALYQKIYKQIV